MRRSRLFLCSVFLAGCNAVLGIDEARLGADAGLGDSGAVQPSTSTDSGGACSSLEGTNRCNACVAQRCCAEYNDCVGDPMCKRALVDYAFCLGNNFTSDAGETCDEDFAMKAGLKSSRLASCAILDKCRPDCNGQTIGDLCVTYCGCMQDVCGDFPFEGGSCEQVCDSFDPNQFICRPYHCNLATLNKSDPDKRRLHCGHASGMSPCH